MQLINTPACSQYIKKNYFLFGFLGEIEPIPLGFPLYQVKAHQ